MKSFITYFLWLNKYSHLESYLGRRQPSKIELLTKIVNGCYASAHIQHKLKFGVTLTDD